MIPGFFSKLPMPERLPQEMEAIVGRLRKTKTKRACLEGAFGAITRRFHGERLKTILLFWRVWRTDTEKMWHRPGYLHCHQQNHLLRILLVRSGKFTDEDILLERTRYLLVLPHQYLLVNVGKKEGNDWAAADPWAKKPLGIGLGQHAGC